MHSGYNPRVVRRRVDRHRLVFGRGRVLPDERVCAGGVEVPAVGGVVDDRLAGRIWELSVACVMKSDWVEAHGQRAGLESGHSSSWISWSVVWLSRDTWLLARHPGERASVALFIFNFIGRSRVNWSRIK